jgi:hypothetical protein
MKMRTIRLLLAALLFICPVLYGIGLEDMPGDQTAICYAPSHAAATATESYPIFTAPFDCSVTNILVVPAAAVTGAATHYTKLQVVNRGTAGSDTTTLGTYALSNGNNLAIMDEYSPYTPASGLSVSDGNVLALEFEKVGNGILVPALLIQVTYRAR